MDRQKEGNRTVLMALAIIVMTLIGYSPLPGNRFVILDDPEYITENLSLLGGLNWEGVRWAFTTTYQQNWHPLTWLSHMLDVQLFGLNATGHHLVSLAIHLANSLLLFALLRRMTGALWKSGIVALLFAIHPLHVESVAWGAERKDVLAALFWLLTIRSYLLYTDNPGWKRYLSILFFFALGIMSKGMVVTLPCVLLLLDYWPLQRKKPIGSLITEKIPLFLMSAACSIVTYRVQRGCGKSVMVDLDAQMNALQAYVGYLAKTVWPVKLAALYPYAESNLTLLRTGGAALLLLAVTIAVVAQWRRRPYLPVGWLWFLGTLLPVIGSFRIGFHSMADRYTYLPHIGLFIMVIWGVADLLPGTVSGRRAAAGAAVVIMTFLTILTYRQVRIWHDTISLMSHAVSVTDRNWFAYNNLACAYHIIGAARRETNISASLPLEPDTLERREMYMRFAAAAYAASLEINPDYVSAANNLQMAKQELEKIRLLQQQQTATVNGDVHK